MVGVTTNPTIFASALAKGNAYDEQLRQSAEAGMDVDQALFELTTRDVRDACDVLRPLYEDSNGVDGRVSIEVDPRLARDTSASVDMALALFEAVDRPNVMIKIPATEEGLPAITQVISRGISVNVTLIFALARYRDVMQAYIAGLELAQQLGQNLSTIHSVASFFISRVDSQVDERLDAVGTDEARSLKGQAAIANARLAFEAFEETFSTPRWHILAEAGANPQRPLWASTGVKNPAYPDTMYVAELVAAGVVNTMPSTTLEAVADHAQIAGDTMHGTSRQAGQVLVDLASQGISFDDVTQFLERDGLSKFEKSWDELTTVVAKEHPASNAVASQ